MIVGNSRGEIFKFRTDKECIEFISKKVREETEQLYDDNIIDKYAVHDILFLLKDRIKYDNGFSHPDLQTEWEMR